jgi:hypothetical protein
MGMAGQHEGSQRLRASVIKRKKPLRHRGTEEHIGEEGKDDQP